ncbi:MAG: O-methyltransferase [Armatimonadetes bacterium]|nr:O-methyltransferase [Armatimonadota bacterium]
MPVDFLRLQVHLEAQVPPRPAELVSMESYAKDRGFPILGPASCQCCYVLAKAIGARSVFELGSGFGYSTAWFARAVDENGGGTVRHTVWDEDLSARAQRHLTSLGYLPKGSGARTEIEYSVAEAVGVLRADEGTYDIVFNDIDKTAYPETIEVVYPRLRPGGFFITDNVVWGGRVYDAGSQEESTVAIRDFCDRMTKDPRWACTTVPIRDGLFVALKL